MGAACARGLPTEYEEAIAGRLNAQAARWSPKRANKTAPAKETLESEISFESKNTVEGTLHQPEPKVQTTLDDDDFINSLLRRANAGGNEERLAAAIAAAPETPDGEDSEVSEDDGKLQRLLGGPFPASSSTAPVAVQDAMLELMSGRETLSQPQQLENRDRSRKSGGDGRSGMASLKAMGHPEQVVRAAARLGAVLPSTKTEDDTYSTLDAYVDDALGIPHSSRPKGWQQRPSIVESEAALKGRQPEIIFEDGRRGPSIDPLAQRETMREKQLAQVLQTNVSVPDSGRPSLVGRKSLAPRSSTGRPSFINGATAPYLSNVLDGWATIDGDEAGSKQQALPDPAARILPEINTLGELGGSAAGGVPRSHLGSDAVPVAPQQPASAPRGSFGKAMGMLRGAAPRNSFGSGTTTAAQESSGAAAQRTIGGMTMVGLPKAPRDSSGGAGEPPTHENLGSQQVGVPQRMSELGRPAPKRKAQFR